MSGLPTDFDVSSLESEFAKFGIYGIKAVASDEEDGKAEKSVSVTYSSKTEAAEAAKVSSTRGMETGLGTCFPVLLTFPCQTTLFVDFVETGFVFLLLEATSIVIFHTNSHVSIY